MLAVPAGQLAAPRSLTQAPHRYQGAAQIRIRFNVARVNMHRIVRLAPGDSLLGTPHSPRRLQCWAGRALQDAAPRRTLACATPDVQPHMQYNSFFFFMQAALNTAIRVVEAQLSGPTLQATRKAMRLQA